jgi:hypothetical protein
VYADGNHCDGGDGGTGGGSSNTTTTAAHNAEIAAACADGVLVSLCGGAALDGGASLSRGDGDDSGNDNRWIATCRADGTGRDNRRRLLWHRSDAGSAAPPPPPPPLVDPLIFG